MTELKGFIKRATMFLKDNDSDEKKVYNASRKADSHLKQVLAALEGEKVNAEVDIDTRKEEYEQAKYSLLWLTDPKQALSDIDKAKEQLDTAKERLENINSTIAEREALVTEYKKNVQQ